MQRKGHFSNIIFKGALCSSNYRKKTLHGGLFKIIVLWSINCEPDFCSVMVWRALQHLQAWVSLNSAIQYLPRVSFDMTIGNGNTGVQASISYPLLSSKLQAPCWVPWSYPFNSRNLLLAGFLVTLQHFLFPSTGNTGKGLSSGSFRASASLQNKEMLLCI